MIADDQHTAMSQLFHDSVDRRQFLTRALALGVSLSSLPALLQACGESGAAPGAGSSLKFANWASAESATRDNINKALAVFESQQHAKIENIGIPFDQVLQQLTTMTNGGNPPDVMQLSGNWPYALGGAGALEDLSKYSGVDAWRKDSFANSFEVGTYKGKLYAVPFTITPHGFWYSKDLMSKAGLNPDQPPATIDELNQMMAELRGKLPADTFPIGIDISKTEYALVGFWPWIWTFGGNPMVDDGQGNVTINWADEGTIAAFQWLQDAVKKRWTPPDQAIKAERELMANGKIAFKLDGPYLTGIFANTNPALKSVQAVNDRFGVTTTPTGPGVSTPVTAADIHNLGISAQSHNKELAWKLIEFLTTSKEVITTFLIPQGGMLPRLSYNTDQNLYAKNYSDAINQAFIKKVIPTMRPPAYGPKYSTAATFVVTALQEIAGGAPVKDRLTRLTNEVKTLYS
ncbi:MAG: sugar ABC transporter substrate-binding protein [Ktedonobacteraceae bacterium]|nr:sugar ABC transporter substrate-binding protein [Ktedonobacteraceae bacterium]